MIDISNKCSQCGKETLIESRSCHCHADLMHAVLEVDDESESDELPGIKGYQIIKEIGQGGMGRVYHAIQDEPCRDVAIKLLLDEQINGENTHEKFLQEIELAAKLEHHAIVPIYGSGRQDGFLYYSSRLMVGGDLSAHLARYLPTHEHSQKELMDRQRMIVKLVMRIADGLFHAHQRGVMHRDVKTSNILIDEVGNAFICDFGLAREFNNCSQFDEKIISGSPSYMAPEQLNGNECTLSVDLYALGIVLYELLNGTPPFESRSLTELVQKVYFEKVSFLKEARYQDRTICAICLRCLEKNPNDRYPDMRALNLDLLAWLENRPTVASPLNIFQRFNLWCKREPVRACLALMVFVLSLLGSLSLWGEYIERRDGEKLAVVEEKRNRSLLIDALIERADLAGRELRYNEAVEALTDAVELAYDQPGKRHLALRLKAAWQVSLPAEFHHEGGQSMHLKVADSGKWMATWSIGNTCCIWRLSNSGGEFKAPRLKHTISVGDDHVVDVTFSPNEAQFVISTDCNARIHDVDTAHEIQQLISPGSGGSAKFTGLPRGMCRYSSDGKKLVMALQGKDVIIWEVDHSGFYEKKATIKKPSSVNGVMADLLNIVIVKDQILVAWRGGWMSIRDGKSQFFPARKRLEHFVVSPAASFISVGEKNGLMSVYRLSDLRETSYVDHGYWVTDATFSDDENWLVSSGRNRQIKLWSLSQDGHIKQVASASFSRVVTSCYWLSEEKLLAVTTEGGKLKYYSVPALKLVSEQILTGGRPESWGVSSKYEQVFVGSEHGHLAAYQKPKFPVSAGFKLPDAVREFRRNSVSKSIVGIADLKSGTQNIVVRKDTGISRQFKIGESHVARCLSLSRDGTRVLSGDDNGIVHLWDSSSGKRLWSKKLFDVAIRRTAVEVIKGEIVFAAVTEHEELAFTVVGEMEKVYRFALSDSPPCMRFSPDGKQLAVGMPSGAVMLHLIKSNTVHMRQLINLHRNQVISLEFSPNGDRLASGGMDGLVWLHDMKSGSSITSPLIHEELILTIRFSKDGEVLATSSLARRIKFFHTDGGFQIGATQGVYKNFNDLILHDNNIWGAVSDRSVKKIQFYCE